ncbi:hypothetical protein CA13_16780 [Planctomycetes bacterium CA13]|uniref:Uncharacterized protein n=1 Tax=Novipirellula herctigrandis TaxID=2527986 RepID=A0A5C5YYY0_9BACT|nr:hypothetical protein CA13_16780 [Planctomycetes bacterium CA13]
MQDNRIEGILKAIRNEPVPDDVHELATHITSEFEQEFIVNGLSTSLWERVMKSRVTRFVAAVAAVVIGLVGVGVLIDESVSFAEVVKPLLNAGTVELDFVVGDEKDGPIVHDVVVGSKIRRTFSNMNTVLIIDLDAAKMLALEPSDKSAALVDIKGPVEKGTKNYLGIVRNVLAEVEADPNRTARPLGEREIDGRTAVGFEVGGKDMKLTIWADPETSLAMRIEMQYGESRTVLKNIRFDVDTNESLVSMDVPAGYTLQEATFDMTQFSEKDFVASLEVFAEQFGNGAFPDTLSTEVYMKQMAGLAAKIAPLDISVNEKTQLGIQFARGMLFLQSLDHRAEWGYTGKGVQLGDAENTIFWYQLNGTKVRRVIDGDLKVQETAVAE